MNLVVNRARLPADWPTDRGSSEFWEELGRTIATFCHLEDMLARAYFVLTGTREFDDLDQVMAAFPGWERQMKESLTDSLYSLTSKMRDALNDDDHVAVDFSHDFLARLDKIRVWRNALCHGAWQSFEADGSASLRHFKKAPDGPERLEASLNIEEIASIRAATVELTADVVDIVTAAGVLFPGTLIPGMGRMDGVMHPLN